MLSACIKAITWRGLTGRVAWRLVCVVVSTIYEGSDESKSKTGSTDSHRSSSTASSGHSATTQSTAATTHNWSAAVSGMMPPCHVSVMEDVTSAVCAFLYVKRVKVNVDLYSALS